MKNIFNKYKEVIMYLIFGVLTTFFSIAIYWLLTITFLNPNSPIQLQIANILSWIGGVLFAYFTNRKYVFESKNKNKFKEFSSFVGARVITLLFDMAFMFVFVTILHLNDKVIKLISTFIVIASNYIFSKLFVFKEKQETSNENISTSYKVINYIFWGLGIIIVLFYLFMFFYKQPLVNEEVLPDVTNSLIPWEVKEGESFIKAILTRPFDLKITEYGQYRPRYLAFLVQFLDENTFLSIVRTFPAWGNRLLFYIIAMFLTVFSTYYFIRSFYKKLPKGVSFFVASTIIIFQNYQVTTYWRARSAKLLALPACIFLLTYALKNLNINFEKKNWKKLFLAIPVFILMTLDEQVLALVAMILAFAILVSIINKKVNIISPIYFIACILYASFHLWWGKALFLKYTGSYTPHGHTIDGAVSGINLLSIWQSIQILSTTIGKVAFLSIWIFVIVFIYSLYRFLKGKISKEKENLLKHTKEALYIGINEVKPGAKIGNIGARVQGHAKKHHLGVVRELCGHGVGRDLHEDPDVPNFGKYGTGVTLEEGMVIAIEPMLTLGSEKIYCLSNEWTIVTRDKKPSAHFEHTVLVTKDGYEILTGE